LLHVGSIATPFPPPFGARFFSFFLLFFPFSKTFFPPLLEQGKISCCQEQQSNGKGGKCFFFFSLDLLTENIFWASEAISVGATTPDEKDRRYLRLG